MEKENEKIREEREVSNTNVPAESSKDAVVPEKVVSEEVAVEEPAVEKPVRAKTVDEEWAEVLQVKFDQEAVNQTPPPIPGHERQATTSGNAPLGGRGMIRPKEEGKKDVPPMPSTWMIWAVLCAVFCCTIPGIVALVFSSQVSSRWSTGDFEGAERSSRNAEIWIIVSFVLGVVSATLWLPVMLIS